MSETGSETPSFADELIDKLTHAHTRCVEKPWGEEVIIEAEGFIIKLITVENHHRTSLQHHERKTEVSVVVRGRGGVRAPLTHDDEMHLLGGLDRPSNPVRINPYEIHRTYGPCTLIEVTTPDDDDIVRHEDDYAREDM